MFKWVTMLDVNPYDLLTFSGFVTNLYTKLAWKTNQKTCFCIGCKSQSNGTVLFLTCIIHTDYYKTTMCYTRLINTSPIYPHCQQATKCVEYAPVEYLYTFWPRLSCLSLHNTVDLTHALSFHCILPGIGEDS
jgi:hypothetical protein